VANDELIEVIGPNPADTRWRPVIGPVTNALQGHFVTSRMLPTAEASQQVIDESVAIVTACGQPGMRVGEARTGLVCGYVQSGKTASMTAVAALAKDNGYRIVVLIAGITTLLLDQNRSRLETDLRAATPEWAWLMLTNPTLRGNRHDLESLVREWTHYDESDRRTLLITVMKHHSHLENAARLLTSCDLSAVPVLIFDDEADQASLNTRPTAAVPSSTYRAIAALRAAVPGHTYLQYTATPQAPLLITRIDALSAHFAELVSPGDGYTGGVDYFVNHRESLCAIPLADILDDRNLPDEPPTSLLEALRVFFLGVAAGRIDPITSHKHRSMLIHPSKSTITHSLFYRWTNDIRSAWERVLADNADPDHAELLDEFRASHADLTTTSPSIPPFEVIARRLPAAMNQTAVTLVNSVDGREVPWSNGYAHILVGGEKLGRGYTVKGITVTYMPRLAATWTADTIQQRARFFGYHRTYLGYCRVYLHPNALTVYTAYVEHEEDMRKRLREHGGRPLREWKRLFYLDRSLAPTRRNVLSSSYVRPHLTNGWLEPRAPHESPGEGAQNLELLRVLDGIRFEPHHRYAQHYEAIVRLQDIFEQILVPLVYSDEQDALGLCVVNCNIKTLLERDADASCLVVRMNYGERPRVRRLDNDGFIPELFQGRSSAGAHSYPGDRTFADDHLPTLQVHTLRVEHGGRPIEPVVGIAVRLPRPRPVLIHN
jgi:hypothetical protein